MKKILPFMGILGLVGCTNQATSLNNSTPTQQITQNSGDIYSNIAKKETINHHYGQAIKIYKNIYSQNPSLDNLIHYVDSLNKKNHFNQSLKILEQNSQYQDNQEYQAIIVTTSINSSFPNTAKKYIHAGPCSYNYCTALGIYYSYNNQEQESEKYFQSAEKVGISNQKYFAENNLANTYALFGHYNKALNEELLLKDKPFLSKKIVNNIVLYALLSNNTTIYNKYKNLLK